VEWLWQQVGGRKAVPSKFEAPLAKEVSWNRRDYLGSLGLDWASLGKLVAEQAARGEEHKEKQKAGRRKRPSGR